MTRLDSPRPKALAPRPASAPTPGTQVDWLPLGALVLAVLALLVLTTIGLNAQEAAPPPGPPPADAALVEQARAEQAAPADASANPNAAAAATPPPSLNDPAVREAALRMHRERLAQMMEERRQEREADTATQEPGSPQEGVPQAVEPQGQEGEEPTLRRGSAEILSEPLNVSCHVGERFFTSVMLSNSGGAAVDAVKLSLEFDPSLLRPVRVSDSQMRHLLQGEGVLQSDLRRGGLSYEASLEAPFQGLELEMLTIEWETLAPIPRTTIEMRGGREAGNALLCQGRDVLGKADDPDDGTVGTEVNVRPLGDDRLRGALLIDNPDSLREVQGMNPEGGVELALEPRVQSIRAGDTFAVDVRLANPDQTPIDDLRFAIEFDPEVLEVLDAAPSEHRRPGDNWVVGGVNLHDAPFQHDYPFDFHLANEADNQRGLAQYAMGLSRARALPSGTVARIYLRALEPAPRTRLRFLHSDDPTQPTTSVRCLGIDVLGAIREPEDGTADLTLAVAPGGAEAETVRTVGGH